MAISQAHGSGAIDVAEFIDGQPVGGFQIKLLLTCAAVLFLDTFDPQAIGYVAPAFAKEWGLRGAAWGPVFSAGLFGLMIGALLALLDDDHIVHRIIDTPPTAESFID